MNTKS